MAADNYQMTYAEFLESLGRLAQAKYPQAEDTLARKLERFLEVLVGPY